MELETQEVTSMDAPVPAMLFNGVEWRQLDLATKQGITTTIQPRQNIAELLWYYLDDLSCNGVIVISDGKVRLYEYDLEQLNSIIPSYLVN